MKRLLLTVSVLLITFSQLYAVYQKMLDPKSIELQAGYGAVAELAVDRIPAQTEQYRNGMPFDIEDNYVQYGVTEDGREIAYWSVIANTKFSLRISATPLMHENGGSEPLYYTLKFTYNLGYYDSNGEKGSAESDFWFTTGNKKAVSDNGAIDGDSFSFFLLPETIGSGYVGSAEGSIYFEFAEESTEVIRDDTSNLPVGNYFATVTIAVVAEDQ